MSLKEDLIKEIKDIIKTQWTERDGYVVPKPEDVKLLNDGVKINVTMLYSDLVHSTDLTMKETKYFASEVYKCFLSSASRIIKYWDGYIRSFDGDRVMAVFIGDDKNSNAVAAALEISHAVNKLILPEIQTFYNKSHNYFNIDHCTGIDTSEIFIVRGGVKIDNDLVWIGRAANVASKLSEVRNGNYTIISDAVYDSLGYNRKYLNDIDDNYISKYIWSEKDWNEIPGIRKIYCSHWYKVIN